MNKGHLNGVAFSYMESYKSGFEKLMLHLQIHDYRFIDNLVDIHWRNNDII